MFRFLLPDIGEGVVEAEVIEWRVREGERVAQDQVLVELMTDKANIEIPSPVAGVVRKLGFAKGDIVPVGAVLIEIDDGADAQQAAEPRAATAPAGQATPAERPAPAPAPQTSARAARSESEPQRPMTTPAPKPPAAPARPVPAPRATEAAAAHPPAMPPRPGLSHHRAAPGAREEAVHAVPAVRELAKRLGVELERVRGTGPGGRVMRRDVEAAAAAPAEQHASAARPAASATAEPAKGEAQAKPAAPDPPDWRRVPLRGLRRAIARHMREARQHAAHFTYVEELDLTELMEKSDALGGQKLSPLAFIARAVVRALPDHPSLNASLDEARDEVVYKQKVHLGIAVAAPDGLVVPVIRDAAALTTRDLALATDALARRAREGKLTPDELRGGTFTISSLGKLGGIVSTPIVNYPEVAILGVNAIRKLPRFVGDRVVARRLMNLSISVDHRVADGAHAAQFIADVKALLESTDFPDVFETKTEPPSR
ncbi:MAG TPA: dihydrolipoamide acetyltransferase family protein [Myxococcota bacterium]|nr:dihydrolipoamide acetyltransferase family protein [Myxococcota bacterium]